jgi:hypothetical protein
MAGQNQRSVTREIPRLTLRAQFDLSTVDLEKRTVDLVWTTGARVLRGFFEPYFEELSLDPKHVRMGRLQSGAAPLLNSHRDYDITDILGVVDSATLSKKEGRATVRFDSGEEGEDAFRRVREGTLRNVSVGYATYRMQKIEDGSTTTPVYRAVDWEPFEISLLPIGADAGAGTRSAGPLAACVFFEERAMDPDANPTTAPTPAPAPTAAPTQTAAPAPVDVAAIERRAMERVLGIQRVARALGRPDAEAAAAIANGTSLEMFRAAAVDAMANASPENGGVIPATRAQESIVPGEDARDKWRAAATAALIVRGGMSAMFMESAKKRGEKLDLSNGPCHGMTLRELARDSLEQIGVRTRGMGVDQMIGLAFTYRAGNTTSDFPIVLENLLNKSALSAYSITPDTWRGWCGIGTLTDFRPHNRYRPGSFGVLDLMPEGAEYKTATIPDSEKQAITGLTKGRMVSISRQMIINDDMGAFNDVATRLGRAAALTIEVDAYAALIANPVMSDGLALFHATHNNIGAGGAAISVATVDADRVLMGSQQDPAKNEFLDMRPAVLLVPLGLGGQARVINNSQYDVDKVANGRQQEPNKVAGLYRSVIDTPRLTGTTRYSFADPNIYPIMEVAFLEGRQEPYMDVMQGWRVDGAEYKCRLDYGVAPRDWRGVVRNPGV